MAFEWADDELHGFSVLLASVPMGGIMRHVLISILVLAAAGCSASGDDVDHLEPLGVSERPDPGADELVDELDPALGGGGYGMLLFDTTSSMNTVRTSTGNTRCTDAKTMAKGMVNDFFNPAMYNGDGIAIWGFTNNPSTSDDNQPTMVGYYTDATSAKLAITGLSCSGSAPLADALCKGVNGDGETFTLNPLLDMMFVVTDGVENSSNGACSGTSGSVTTPGTWQYNVNAQMLATGIRVDVRYWIDPAFLASPDTIDSLAAEDEEPFDPSVEELQLVADIEGLSQEKLDELLGANAASGADASGAEEGAATPGPKPGCGVACQELTLFRAMAEQSGGTWGVVKDDDGHYPQEETTDPDTGPVHPANVPATPVADAG